MEEYIEIVHSEPGILEMYRKEGFRQRAIADRISELEKTVGIHYINGQLDEDIPDLPKDTLIRIGGGLWEICVRWRAEVLRKAGYTNVVADRQISFSSEDAFLDKGLIIEDQYPSVFNPSKTF